MTSGIYCITCIPTGDRYVGFSGGIEHRVRQHRTHLRMKTHFNSSLQNLWNLHGEDDFAVCVLQKTRCIAVILRYWEAVWLYRLRPSLNEVYPSNRSISVYRDAAIALGEHIESSEAA